MANHPTVPTRIVHMAAAVNGAGGVSAACFVKPRAIDLVRATWTLRPDAVTCPRCRRTLVMGGLETGQPQRLQLSRRRGARLPPGTVKVDRTNKLLGNPFRPIDPKNPEHVAAAVAYYDRYLDNPGAGHFECGPETGVALAFVPAPDHARRVLDALPQLRGRNLGCWCRLGSPCHGDILLRRANTDGGADSVVTAF